MKSARLVAALILAVALVGACANSESSRQDSDDRVSIGYGDVEKDNVTGSVSVITREDIERRNVTDAAQLFAGHPGVQVIHTAEGIKVQIRGIHSFSSGSNSPLFVLDGTPLQTGPSGVISFLNPNDIERIEILKGAAASIYGTRGSNGVVLITTRKVR